MANRPTTDYPLGSADDEHERLIRQAIRLESCTGRFFSAAGIAEGQRVLDMGSGVGDVAMLVARMVGPSGQVVGVERDSRSLARARARVTEARLHNVSFIQADVGEVKCDLVFDANCRPFNSAIRARSRGRVAFFVYIDSSRRSPCLPGDLLRSLSCAFRALAALVCGRFGHSRNVPSVRGKNRNWNRPFPLVPREQPSRLQLASHFCRDDTEGGGA